jgi:hypothetical protein
MTPTAFCAVITIAAQTFMPMSSDKVDLACDHAATIIQEAKRNNLDATTLFALIWVESRWSPTAVSKSGACGLTQVLPRYVDETCSELKVPATSIKVGSASLKKWSTIRVRRNGKMVRIPRPGGIRAALACYNAGYACLKSSKGKYYADSIIAKSAKLTKVAKQNPSKGTRKVTPETMTPETMTPEHMILYQADKVLAYTPWHDGAPAEQYIPVYVPGFFP